MKNFLSTALLLAQLAAVQGAPSARSNSSNLARSKGLGFQHQPIKQAPQAAAGTALLSADLVSTPILTSAAATFTAPIPTDSSITAGQAASIWVGIDGFVNTGAILQAGIDVNAASTSTGEVEYVYTAWYEWYPANAVDFSPEALAIKGGDVIVATVYATSSCAGAAVIENTSAGRY